MKNKYTAELTEDGEQPPVFNFDHEPVIEEPAAPPQFVDAPGEEPVISDAQTPDIDGYNRVLDYVYVYDCTEADMWLSHAWRRTLGNIEKVRIEPEGIEAKQFNFALFLIVLALKTQVLYVPLGYADLPEFVELLRGDDEEGYATFTKVAV